MGPSRVLSHEPPHGGFVIDLRQFLVFRYYLNLCGGLLSLRTRRLCFSVFVSAVSGAKTSYFRMCFSSFLPICLLNSGIRRRDNRAHRLLVEALVSLAALEVLEVAADRAFGEEPGVLGAVDPAELEQPIGAGAAYWPALAGGEGLAQEGEVGEGGHGVDAGLGLEVNAQVVEGELCLDVVHAGLEQRLAVQPYPEPDGVRTRQLGERLVREAVIRLVG